MSELRFGGYRITGTLGSGALSTIFKAVQEPLGRVVALKALKTQIAPTSSFGEQLDREAKILADLAHPNVVLLLEASRTASGRPYVVLELIDGPSLHELLAKVVATQQRGASQRLSVAASLAIACGICAALEHVHQRGIVHRDVKPSNVLLSRAGSVKVIDFGIAQRPRTVSMSDALGTESITAAGRIAPEQVKDAFGTPAYMSPEQILGDFVDGRSDLFSLGVVLYQMLSGSRPFEVADAKGAKPSAAQRIRRDAPAPLRERAPHCPRVVERIVMRLLEKSPSDRYPSAGAVKERLETALRAETRDDQALLVRAVLVDAGFDEKDDTPDKRAKSNNGTRRPRGGSPGPGIDDAIRKPKRTHPSIGPGRAMLGFAAVTLLFAIGVVAIEGTRAQARDGRDGRAPGRLELAPESAGGLRVIASPWAHVRVDGQLVETTPFARAIPLTSGKHWVTLTHPDAPAAVEREIIVLPGEILSLDVTLSVGLDDAGRDAR